MSKVEVTEAHREQARRRLLLDKEHDEWQVWVGPDGAAEALATQIARCEAAEARVRELEDAKEQRDRTVAMRERERDEARAALAQRTAEVEALRHCLNHLRDAAEGAIERAHRGRGAPLLWADDIVREADAALAATALTTAADD